MRPTRRDIEGIIGAACGRDTDFIGATSSRDTKDYWCDVVSRYEELEWLADAGAFP